MKWLSHLALWQPLTLAWHKNNILCSKWNHLWVNQCGWQTCSKCLTGPEAKPRLVWKEVVRLSMTCHPKNVKSVTRPSRRRLPSPATLEGGNNLLLPSDHQREVWLFRSSDGARHSFISVIGSHQAQIRRLAVGGADTKQARTHRKPSLATRGAPPLRPFVNLTSLGGG